MEHYLEFIAEAKQIDADYDLNHHEVRLLDLVGQLATSGTAIFVKDIICQRQIASQATLHKALSALVRKNLVTLKIQKSDARAKQVLLTRIALGRYKLLNQAIKRHI